MDRDTRTSAPSYELLACFKQIPATNLLAFNWIVEVK